MIAGKTMVPLMHKERKLKRMKDMICWVGPLKERSARDQAGTGASLRKQWLHAIRKSL